jgi:hypothetical protein
MAIIKGNKRKSTFRISLFEDLLPLRLAELDISISVLSRQAGCGDGKAAWREQSEERSHAETRQVMGARKK